MRGLWTECSVILSFIGDKMSWLMMQVNAMLPPAEGYDVKQQLPSRLPLAFQPDLLAPDLDPNPGQTLGRGQRRSSKTSPCRMTWTLMPA
jgi:hypothetical protein